MICKYSYKRQIRAPHCTLYSSPRQRTVGAPPALHTRKPGFKSEPLTRISSEPGLGLSQARAIPIAYLHVKNNNTQGVVILHNTPWHILNFKLKFALQQREFPPQLVLFLVFLQLVGLSYYGIRVNNSRSRFSAENSPPWIQDTRQEKRSDNIRKYSILKDLSLPSLETVYNKDPFAHIK
mgnify:CR=1 FL=1